MKFLLPLGKLLVELSLHATRFSRAWVGWVSLVSLAGAVQAATVAAPTFSPVAGTYTSVQTVTIATTTTGASIRYTVDGTTPSSTAGTLYSSPVSIGATTTVKAIAFKSGSTNSSVTTGTYTINLPVVATPTFSPVAGTYTSAQTVTITSATSGSSIHYTIDGSTPSATAGTLYSTPVSIGATTTLKAIAFKTGSTNSSVTSGVYTINLPVVATPTFSPAAGTYTSVQNVTIASATSGASIRYTTDGTTPSATAGTLYSTPVSIGTTTTLKAIAFKTGSTNSSVTSGVYTINLPVVATPTFSPIAGTYTSIQTVTISSTTSGASINYTTDSSTPSATVGTLYSTPVSIGATTTVKAIAFKTGSTNSSVTSGVYTINLPVVATPTFSPAAGTYTSVQNIAITSTTSGASIRYTTDGSTPSTTAGTLYSAPVSIGVTTTLKAIAFKTGLTNSAVTSGSYTINLPAPSAPTFSPSAGTYTSAQTVTITSVTSGASIRYTTDGSTPSATAGTLYSAPVTIGATTTLKAIAFRAGSPNSTVTSGTFTITLPVGAPVFNPVAGSYVGAQIVTITSTTTGASIRYTLDGSTPSSTVGAVYSGPLTFDIFGGYTLKAIAYKSGLPTSSVTTGSFTINQPVLPYTADFESTEGYTLAGLNRQLGWMTGTGTITNLDSYHGTQSIQLPAANPAGYVQQSFASSGNETVEFFDFFAKPVAGTPPNSSSIFSVEQSRFAFQLSGSQGVLEVFSGDLAGSGTWVATPFVIPLGAGNKATSWVRLTVRLDFINQTWDLYANSAMVAADIPFINSSTFLSGFQLQGDITSATGLDDIFAGSTDPLFADVNNDGIDDTWETAHGLSLTVNERYLSPTGTGLTVLQAYLAGTNPTDFYGNVVPVLTSLVSGGQVGHQGLISVKVTKVSDGSVLANAPVTFTETTGASLVASSFGGAPATSLRVFTNAQGVAQVYLTFAAGQSDVIVATAQSQANPVSISIPVNAPLPPPPSNGVSLWLDAGAGVITNSGGAITQWLDQSGNANIAFPSGTVFPMVQQNALNGLPVMHFAGGFFAMQKPMAGVATAADAFIIVRAATATPSASSPLWQMGSLSGQTYPDTAGNVTEGFGSDQLYQTGAPPIPLTSFHLYNVSSQTGSLITRFNGATHFVGTGNSASFPIPLLGANSSHVTFNGDVAEMIVYDHVLTDSDRAAVMAFFANKYALFARPSVPTAVSAIAISSSQASITWQGSPAQVGITYLVNRSTSGAPYVTVGKIIDSTSYIDGGLTGGVSYSYTVIASTSANSSLASSPASVTTPLLLPGLASGLTTTGLRLWLKADAGIEADLNGNVTLWGDQSSNGYLLSPASGGSLPQLVAGVINGRPVVHFGGNVNLPLPNLMTGAGGGDAFVVLRSTMLVPPANNGLWNFGGSGNGAAYPDPSGNVGDDFGSTQLYATGTSLLPVTTLQLYNVSAQTGSWINRLNGITQYISTSNLVAFSASPALGRDGNNNFFNGDIAEIMVYDHVLSDADRATVGAYLAQKFLLPSRIPAAPTGVTVAAISSTQTSIIWQGDPNNNTGVSYGVQRSTAGGPFVLVGTIVDSYSFLDSGLTGGVSYSYSIVASVVGGTPSATSNTAAVVTPVAAVDLPITGLRLWLSADNGVKTDSNSNVIGWWDRSENYNDALATSVTNAPVLAANVSNGHPVVHFNGNGQSLSLPNFMGGATAGEVFALLRAGATAPGSTNGLWQIGASTSAAYPDGAGNVQDGFGSTQLYQTGTPPVPLTSFQVYNAESQSGSWVSSFNGVPYFTGTGNTVGFTNSPVLGANGASASFNGDVAEMFVYDHLVTAAERAALNGYLTQKYLTLQAWPFAGSPNGDADGDGILNYQDAQPTNASIGALQISITTPATGSIVP